MNLTVFTGPDRAANINDLLRHTPHRRSSVCAVVPDSRSVAALERRLAEISDSSFLGHRIYTMDGLALAILSQSGQAPQIIPPHVKRAVISEVIKSRIGKQSKFSEVASYPGFVSLFNSLLEEIRSRSESSVSLDLELDLIERIYNNQLEHFGLTDHEGTVLLALKGDSVERFAGSLDGSFIIDGFYDMTERQFQLIERLCDAFALSAATLVNDPSRPSLFTTPRRLLSRYRSIGAGIVGVQASETGIPFKVLSGFMGSKYPEDVSSEKVSVHTFRNEQSEADWIAGSIRTMLAARTCKPDEIMIVSRLPQGFGSAVERALRRHGIPVQGGISRPFVTHPVVRLALDALEASIHPEKEHLLACVQRSCFTGDVSEGRTLAWDGIDDRAWSCMTAGNDTPEGYVTSLKGILERLNVKENLSGGSIHERSIFETAGYELLIELLDEFAEIYTKFKPMMRADEFNHLLRQFLGNVSYPDKPSYTSGVLLVDVNHARYISRKIVFVIGLDDATFPARYKSYSLLDNVSAKRDHEHHQAEEPLLFYLAACAAKHLYLTFPGIDDEGSDNAMSPYIREICDGICSWSIPHFHPRVAGAAWENGATDERGQNEQLVRMLKRDYNRVPAVLSVISGLDKSRAELLEKAVASYIKRIDDMGITLTSHPSFGKTQNEWGRNYVFSVTGLELYNSCPIRFFLKKIIGLEVELVTDDIDPAIRGQLVHEILSQFYTEWSKNTESSVFARDELQECKKLMNSIVEKAFNSNIIKTKGLHPVMLLAEKKFINGWMEAFLDNEADYFENTSFQPWAFETTFGHSKGETRTVYPPLKISRDNETILLAGRIDRIDVDMRKDDHCFRVIDYKTGRVISSLNDLTDGYALQIPLYLDAASKHIIPGSSLYDGVYYSLKDMEMKMYMINREPIVGERWLEYIELAHGKAFEAVSAIRDGRFPLPGEKKCPEYCEFRQVCREKRTVAVEDPDAAE
ncbi:PD-(D/E)XK nuclease family protein [Candidatus Latescibacterota bacterium]